MQWTRRSEVRGKPNGDCQIVMMMCECDKAGHGVLEDSFMKKLIPLM